MAVSRLPRHPCRGAHCAIPACGHRGLTGRLRSRSKARSKAEQQQQQSRGAKLHSPPVGAGLSGRRIAAMAVYQSINVLADAPSSQASPLPQGDAHASKIRSAVRPPRFAFDLRRPVKPRWPSSDIDLGGNPAGRRVSRAGPWMAQRGGPPKSMSDDGHTEPRRGAEWWGKSPFGYFWGSFPKVTRRKGGTNSRRNRSNGYVHKPKKH